MKFEISNHWIEIIYWVYLTIELYWILEFFESQKLKEIFKSLEYIEFTQFIVSELTIVNSYVEFVLNLYVYVYDYIYIYIIYIWMYLNYNELYLNF